MSSKSETPPHLTFEEHCELARELRSIDSRIRELHYLVASIYGPSNRVLLTFKGAADALAGLCNDMQTRVAKDYPGRQVAGLYR
jgi:hypothetical protein